MNLQENAHRIGQSLQDKRASLKLEAGDAARQIKISVQFVHYIESGEWDKLGPRVYAKGHLLAYARALSTETGKIEDHFAALIAEAEQETEETLQRTDLMPVRQSMMERVGQSMNHLGYVAATALIAVPAIFALILAFQSTEDSATSVADSQTSNERMSQEATDPVLASMTPVIKSVPSRPAIDLTNLGFESSSSPTPFSEANQGQIPTVVTIEPDRDPLASLTGTEAISHPFAISVSDAVWVEIYNFRGDRLAYGLKNQGWNMQFATNEGLEVRLGNVRAVTAQLNEQPFDLAPYTREDLATFSLPGQE